MRFPELEIWERVHGKPLTLGTKVKVTEDFLYIADWQGEFYVVGINADRQDPSKVDITLVDNGTHYDGFAINEILPVAQD